MLSCLPSAIQLGWISYCSDEQIGSYPARTLRVSFRNRTLRRRAVPRDGRCGRIPVRAPGLQQCSAGRSPLNHTRFKCHGHGGELAYIGRPDPQGLGVPAAGRGAAVDAHAAQTGRVPPQGRGTGNSSETDARPESRGRLPPACGASSRSKSNERTGATCVQSRACQAASRSTNLPNRSWNSCIEAMTACRSAPAGSLLAVSRRRRNVLIKSTISSEFRWGNMESPIYAGGSATCLSATGAHGSGR
jgi:hypothetical protein